MTAKSELATVEQRKNRLLEVREMFRLAEREGDHVWRRIYEEAARHWSGISSFEQFKTEARKLLAVLEDDELFKDKTMH